MAFQYLIVPQWQGSGSARALQLQEGAQAIRGDLPASRTTTVEVPLGAGESLGSGIRRISSLQAVGWDGCATATNHSLDRRVAGLEYTLDIMDEFGMGHTGTGRTPEETVSPQFYEVTKDRNRREDCHRIDIDAMRRLADWVVKNQEPELVAPGA